MLTQMHKDEASFADRLRQTESRQQAAYDQAHGRLEVMSSTHSMYQEETEKELSQLRPCAEEWLQYTQYRQLQADELLYETALRAKAVEDCDALKTELTEAKNRLTDEKEEFRRCKIDLNAVRLSEQRESKHNFKLMKDLDECRTSVDRKCEQFVE